MVKKNTKLNRKILILILLDVFALSFGHAINSGIIILLSLVGFTAIVLFSPNSTFFPIMLFYLPWSTIMKFSSESFSFYTLVVPIYFVFLLLSKMVIKRERLLKFDILLTALVLIIFTLIVKTFLGYMISLSYIMFIMMLVFIPTYINEYKKELSFEECIKYFSIGIIGAGTASKILMNYPHMLQYIDVYEWEKVGLTRLSGFYGDANFYASHILVAICGLLIIAINKQFKEAIQLFILVIVLIYFGFLSVSKMFLVVLIVMLGIWIMAVLSQRNKLSTKAGILFCFIIGVIFISSSGIFVNQINMYLIRFGMVNDAASLTTGRSEILFYYLSFFEYQPMALLFGQGFTDVYSGEIYSSAHNTLIQAIYQFGILGLIFLIIYIFQLNIVSGKFKEAYSMSKFNIVAFGCACFIPWLSLDILFFDEFFYITVLFIIGKNYIVSN